jgi:hypothetical protein
LRLLLGLLSLLFSLLCLHFLLERLPNPLRTPKNLIHTLPNAFFFLGIKRTGGKVGQANRKAAPLNLFVEPFLFYFILILGSWHFFFKFVSKKKKNQIISHFPFPNISHFPFPNIAKRKKKKKKSI